MRAPWLASVGFKQPINTWNGREDVVQQVAPRYNFTYGYQRGVFCFSRSLIGGFSLQSWCVQGSIGSAEGSVLPSSDREQCGKIVGGYEGSTKTSKLLSEKAHKS